MATAGDRTARIWTTGNVEAARRLLARRDSTTSDSPSLGTPGEPEAALRGVAFSPKLGTAMVLTAGADGVAYPWDISGPDVSAPTKPLPPFEPESPGSALADLAISPDGREFATAGLDGKVRVWRLEHEARTKPKVITADLAKPGVEAGAALGVTFSPKGRYLLTSWADGRMRLFRRDGDDWKPVTDWPGSALRLTPQLFDQEERFVVTPNAGLLRVEGDKGSVSLWEVSNARVPTWTKPAGGPVSDVAIHPQNRAIAAATMGPSGTVVVWDDAGNRTGTCIRHPARVERLAFSPNGRALATEAEDGLGRIWDWPCEGGQPRETLVGLTGPSPMLAFSKDSSHLITDGGYLATNEFSTVGQIWDRSQKTAIPLKGPRDRVVTLAFTRVGDEPEVLSINRENQLQRWSMNGAEKGDPRGSCRGPSLAPTAAAIQLGGALAASGTDDGTLKLWRIDTGEDVADLKEHKRRINSLAFSDDGRRLVSAGDDGLACVWAVPERDPRSSAGLKLVARLEHKGQQVSVARFLDREGQRVVTGTGDLKRTRWQLEPDLPREAKVCRLDSVNPVADPLRVDAFHDLKRGNLRVDAAFGVVTAAVSPADGRVFLGCGGPDSRFNLVWSPASHDDKSDSQSYLGHTESILDVAVSPDGQRLATASTDNTARVWTIGKPADVVELRGHTGDVASVTFSPDSRYVLTISRQDGTARVWDRDGGDALYVLGTRRAGFNSATLNDPAGPRQYTDDVVAAAFSPDGKWVVTASGDGTARAYRLSLCGGFDDLKGVADYRRDGFWPEGKAPGSSER
jgi:WD40 repeat protein